MKKLKYTCEIEATPNHVYATMLGLNDKGTYEKWTAEFNPTSTWEGDWSKGSKMLFLGLDENGNRGGMVSQIVENNPGKFVSIRHYGILEGDAEITEGPKVSDWANAHENYTFEETKNGTLVTIDMESNDEHADYFDTAWPKALQSLKQICEASGTGSR